MEHWLLMCPQKPRQQKERHIEKEGRHGEEGLTASASLPPRFVGSKIGRRKGAREGGRKETKSRTGCKIRGGKVFRNEQSFSSFTRCVSPPIPPSFHPSLLSLPPSFFSDLKPAAFTVLLAVDHPLQFLLGHNSNPGKRRETERKSKREGKMEQQDLNPPPQILPVSRPHFPTRIPPSLFRLRLDLKPAALTVLSAVTTLFNSFLVITAAERNT